MRESGCAYSPVYCGLRKSDMSMMTNFCPPLMAKSWVGVANMLCTPPASSCTKFAATVGCAGVERSRMTTPFTRFEAPSRESAAQRPSGETVTSLMVRASTWTESVLNRLEGSVMS